jgi:hypothetical protein
MNILQNFKNQPLVKTWIYVDQEGKPIMQVARYESPGSKKEFVPYHLVDDYQWEIGSLRLRNLKKCN